MNICSVIVHAKPERAAKVQSTIEEIEGAEVHGGADQGKLIVTVENEDDSVMADTITSFTRIEGVINTSMIYHHYEELKAETGAVE
ncbi:MAG: chaperone NapD [Gammaproteobacteria bacterium]|jgi:nitrate reductase NapD|nr:chaperone NapD [Gammaproteobacteria bacterium]MBT4811739.1 chaperone NapD [Thiotrichales bacterium]MBT3473466.1 chaperone NapD [Gammaproteobacteria bacterium]MBT3718212.1 chaperone NapD [Gammaproteobacteria bacterium]MBT3966400.1 chaperone NapD [Gammaproteobacteria bacterium]